MKTKILIERSDDFFDNKDYEKFSRLKIPK